MASAELSQVIALGCGVEPDGSITEGTRARALLTAQFVTDHAASVVAVDFSGKYSCYGKVPVSGTEADWMDQVAEEEHMPRDGINVFLDREADDTAYNWLYGIRRNYLDPTLVTHVATHSSHWPRSQFIGKLAMPKAHLRPVLVTAGNSAASVAKERILLAGYRHIMRNVEPGDLDSVEEAGGIMRRAAMSVLNPSAQPDFITTADRIGYMWDLIRGEG